MTGKRHGFEWICGFGPKGVVIQLCLLGAIASFCAPVHAQSEEDEECMMCHDDRSMRSERDGREINLFVNYRSFAMSVHAEEGCVSCHADVDVDDLPHEDVLEKVECDMCHDDASSAFMGSLHGKALERNRFLAPTCTTCHGKHNMRSKTDERAPTYVSNIPSLCGRCHKEGTRVNELRSVSQRHVLEDYAESIHGDGLFRRGLIVTAVCTSCHFAHNILPHEDRASSINRANIATTCQQCHRSIEQVHTKVINGELWEQKPHQIPNCVDCHQPHMVRRVFYEESFPNSRCLTCHEDPSLKRVNEAGEEESLFVDKTDLQHSMHAELACYKCHTNVSTSREPVCVDSGPVDCSMCHAEAAADYAVSTHGTLRAEGNTDTPYCTTCHTDHGTLGREDPESPIFARNLPDLCGTCHEDGPIASATHARDGTSVVANYSGSIHGRALIDSGLLVTATCVDCHTAHRELPLSDSLSTVNRDNVAATCAQCHDGILEKYNRSIHSPLVNDTDKKLPVCNDCHQSHTIKRVDEAGFREQILNQCGDCHEEVTETYFDTFHGKVSQLGSSVTARCSDCHGSHLILPPTEPESALSRGNVVATCGTCHPNSNRQFVGYLTHATHHDRDKYPYLYYTFWFMTSLLLGVFSFFGIHTVLWMPRALRERRAATARRAAEEARLDEEFERQQSLDGPESTDQDPDTDA